MSTTVSMIYNICLLAVWVLFLWKNLTPRFSFRVTMLICAVVVPAVALGVNYGLNRLSVLRLISIPLLFLILGLTLYRSPIPLTAFVALLPEATLLMMEMMLSMVFPMLFGLTNHCNPSIIKAFLQIFLYGYFDQLFRKDFFNQISPFDQTDSLSEEIIVISDFFHFLNVTDTVNIKMI